jgi:hypothetical protein
MVASAVPACAGAGDGVNQDVTGTQAGVSSTCRPSELQGLFRGFQDSGASLSGALVVTDSGTRDCWLDGAPQSLRLLDEAGQAVSIRVRALDLPASAGPVKLAPGVAMPFYGAPPLQGSAWVSMTWSNWCAATQPAVRSILVVLPSGGSMAAPVDPDLPSWAIGPPAPRCSSPAAGSSLTYGRFQPAAQT